MVMPVRLNITLLDRLRISLEELLNFLIFISTRLLNFYFELLSNYEPN